MRLCADTHMEIPILFDIADFLIEEELTPRLGRKTG